MQNVQDVSEQTRNFQLLPTEEERHIMNCGGRINLLHCPRYGGTGVQSEWKNEEGRPPSPSPQIIS